MTSFRYTYTIDSRMVDTQGHCRASDLLGLLQEAGTQAGEALGGGREVMMTQYHAHWILARTWFSLTRPLLWGEAVTVHTWHRKNKGAALYRDFDLYCGEEQVGQAVSTWALADATSHKLRTLKDVTQFEGTDGGDLCKDIRLGRMQLPEDMTATSERLMRYSDCDMNGHVNNTYYADFLCDGLWTDEGPKDSFVSGLQMTYLKECLLGETLTLNMGSRDGATYISGSGADDIRRFDGAIWMSPLA